MGPGLSKAIITGDLMTASFGMWENVVRVNGVVRDDIETAMVRQKRVRQVLQMAAPPLHVQSAGGAGTCRVMRKQEESDETPVLKMAGDGDAQL